MGGFGCEIGSNGLVMVEGPGEDASECRARLANAGLYPSFARKSPARSAPGSAAGGCSRLHLLCALGVGVRCGMVTNLAEGGRMLFDSCALAAGVASDASWVVESWLWGGPCLEARGRVTFGGAGGGSEELLRGAAHQAQLLERMSPRATSRHHGRPGTEVGPVCAGAL